VGIYVVLEIPTVAGPSSVVQWVLSGGPYTTASHVRQRQPVFRRSVLSRRHGQRGLDSAQEDARWASEWWVGDPLPRSGLYQPAQHLLPPMTCSGAFALSHAPSGVPWSPCAAHGSGRSVKTRRSRAIYLPTFGQTGLVRTCHPSCVLPPPRCRRIASGCEARWLCR